MKKILIFLIAFLMISTVAAIDSSDWSEINVCGHNFKIPPKYQNGEYLTYSYECGNFIILCADEILDVNYGFNAKIAKSSEDLTINGHPAKYLKLSKGYSKIYFVTGDSIFSINWKGTKITPEVEKIIGSSAKSDMSSSTFYNKLNEAYNNYKTAQSHTTYNMEPDDDVEDYDEYSAYYDVGEAKFTISSNTFHFY